MRERRSATGDRSSTKSTTRTLRFWLGPVLVVGVLMSFLAASYLGGILDPQKHLRDFPIALVNSDEGDVAASGPQNLGNRVAAGLHEGIAPVSVDLRDMGPAEMQDRLTTGRSTARSSSRPTSPRRRGSWPMRS